MLLERTTETSLVEAALAAADRGASSLILVTGPLGIGRSALLRSLPALADGHDDVRVLRANAAPMEQDFAFGVVRQLFEGLLSVSPEHVRAGWMDAHASFARHVFADDTGSPGADQAVAATEAVLHGCCPSSPTSVPTTGSSSSSTTSSGPTCPPCAGSPTWRNGCTDCARWSCAPCGTGIRAPTTPWCGR